MTATFGTCFPGSTYIIVEKIYPVDLSAVPWTTSRRKVIRQVSRTCDVQQALYNGEIIDGNPTQWHYLMDALRLAQISYQPTGESSIVLVYHGSDNLLRILPAEFNLAFLPDNLDYLFEEHAIPAIRGQNHGEDPIPDIRLFGDPTIPFYSMGGLEPPTAAAVYHGETGRLELVPPNQLDIMLEQLSNE
ncbi:MAG: hypothetical protein AAGF11_33040 [Myxococcota bacterium]